MKIILSAPDLQIKQVQNTRTGPGQRNSGLESSYGLLAPYFRAYSQKRAVYLNAVDQIICQRILPDARSLLDVGAGDGFRAAKLSASRSLSYLVLAEPSEEMLSYCRQQPADEVWPVAAEDLPYVNQRFDVITCLWNVLGLIESQAKRLEALHKMRSLLSHRGQLFLDVNNRYNARTYGWLPALGRVFYDLLSPSDTNGDVSFTWRIGERHIHSYGHVFRPVEVSRLIEDAGLAINQRHVIDYQTGKHRRFTFEGQLLYELINK